MRISDWSSDVCSSDLGLEKLAANELRAHAAAPVNHFHRNMHTLLTKAHRHRICGRACIYGILDKMVQNLFQPHRIGHDLNNRIPAKDDGMLLTFDRNSILCEGPDCKRTGLFLARMVML